MTRPPSDGVSWSVVLRLGTRRRLASSSSRPAVRPWRRSSTKWTLWVPPPFSEVYCCRCCGSIFLETSTSLRRSSPGSSSAASFSCRSFFLIRPSIELIFFCEYVAIRWVFIGWFWLALGRTVSFPQDQQKKTKQKTRKNGLSVRNFNGKTLRTTSNIVGRLRNVCKEK